MHSESVWWHRLFATLLHAATLRDGAERSQQFAARPTRLYLFGGSADRFPLSSVL